MLPNKSKRTAYSLNDFDFVLPPELIAQEPITQRDQSRLLVVRRDTGAIEHKHFFEIGEYLQPGDLLVRNNSKVIPARLHATKPTGGKSEIFLLQQLDSDTEWLALVRGKQFEPGQTLVLANDYVATLIKKHDDRVWKVAFNKPDITSIGEVPLPPYIKESAPLERYQTVYAETAGSVAAPTAGLHFTPELLAQLSSAGVRATDVTLHVGLGTFAPVEVEDISQHVMHAEYADLPVATANAIAKTKANHKQIVAVGTTSVRTLETFKGQANSGWVNTFITPGYSFNTVDAMITNFHLPKSTLLMLVSAFAGKELIEQAYAEAIKKRYRFYSFGDAMLIV